MSIEVVLVVQLLSEAAPGRMRIAHGDILTHRLDRVFPAHIAKIWEDGKHCKLSQMQFIIVFMENMYISFVASKLVKK